MNELIVAYFGIFLGVLFRTLSPAIRKMKEQGVDFKWDHVYSFTAFLSILLSCFAAYLLLPRFLYVHENLYLVFSSGFSFGFSSNSILNELRKVLFG